MDDQSRRSRDRRGSGASRRRSSSARGPGRRSDRAGRAHARRRQIGLASGVTTLPHMLNFSIIGPHRVTGVSETAEPAAGVHLPPDVAGGRSRRAPSGIIRPLAGEAFRRPLDRRRLAGLLMRVLARRARRAISSRHPQDAAGDSREPAVPVPVRTGAANATPARAIGSARSSWRRRLSFFLWAALPDASCSLAGAGRLATTAA